MKMTSKWHTKTQQMVYVARQQWLVNNGLQYYRRAIDTGNTVKQPQCVKKRKRKKGVFGVNMSLLRTPKQPFIKTTQWAAFMKRPVGHSMLNKKRCIIKAFLKHRCNIYEPLWHCQGLTIVHAGLLGQYIWETCLVTHRCCISGVDHYRAVTLKSQQLSSYYQLLLMANMLANHCLNKQETQTNISIPLESRFSSPVSPIFARTGGLRYGESRDDCRINAAQVTTWMPTIW